VLVFNCRVCESHGSRQRFQVIDDSKTIQRRLNVNAPFTIAYMDCTVYTTVFVANICHCLRWLWNSRGIKANMSIWCLWRHYNYDTIRYDTIRYIICTEKL